MKKILETKKILEMKKMMRKWVCLFSLFVLMHCLPAQEQEIKEKFIYVPYQTWQQVWDNQKSIKLSLEEYKKLSKSQKETTLSQELIVTSANYHGKIHGETLIFDVRLELESLVDHVTFCDFSFGKYGITNAKLDGENAPLFVKMLADPLLESITQYNKNASNIYHQQKNEQINNINVTIGQKYRLKISKKGHHVFRMTCHQNLDVKRDVMSTKIQLGNFPQQIFSLAVDKNYIYETNPVHIVKKNEFHIYPKVNQNISLTIKPKEKQDEKSALLLSKINSSHWIKIDSVKSRFVIDLNVQHQELKTFSFVLPKNLDLLSISENRWDISIVDKQRVLTIQLEKKLLGKHTIFINAETQLIQNNTFELPKVTAIGQKLFRQDGFVYIEKSSDVKLKLLKTEKTRQVDLYTASNNYSNKRSKGKRRGKIHSFGHIPFAIMKIWNGTYKIKLQKSEIQNIIESSTIAGLSIYPDGLELTTDVNFTVVEGDAKQLLVALPKDWLLTKLNLLQLANKYSRFQKVSSSYYVKDNILYLPLERKLQKGQTLKVSISLHKWESSWLSKWSDARYLDLPIIKPKNVKYLPSFMGIIAHQDYALKPRSLNALSSVDLKIIQSVGIESKNLRQGYKIESLEAKGKLEIKQKKANVSVVAAHYIAVQPERVKYATTLVYNVKNASVNSFRFAMPKSFTGILDITDVTTAIDPRTGKKFPSLIKEKKISFENDRKVWQIEMQKGIVGSYALYLTHEVPISKANKTYKCTPIYFYDVTQFNGYFAIQKTSRLDINKDIKNLEEIATKDVPLFAHPKFVATTDFSFAAKYTKNNYSLSLRIGVYDKANVISAILENVTIRSIFPGNELERVECIYQLKHLGEQFFTVKLPEKANFWSAVVNGKGERPLRNKETIAIPIPANNGNAITIRIMYERKVPALDSKGKLELTRPETNNNIPVRSLQWEVYLPRKYQLSSHMGNKKNWNIPWYSHGKSILREIYRDVDYITSGSRSYESNDKSYRNKSKRQIPRVDNIPSPIIEQRRMVKLKPKKSRRYEAKKEKIVIQKPRYRRMKKKANKQTKNRIIRQKQEESKKDLNEIILDNISEKEIELEEQKSEEWDASDVDSKYDDTEHGERGDEWGDIPNSELNSDDQIIDGNIGGDIGGKGKKAPSGYLQRDIKKDGKFWNVEKEKTATGSLFSKKGRKSSIETIKAKGLRSMNIDFNIEQSSEGKLQTSTSMRSINFTYTTANTFRSLFFALTALSMLFNFIILVQRKIPRMLIFLFILLLASFLPFWLGAWTIPFCNAIALGLFLSIFLYMFGGIISFIGKIGGKIKNWSGLNSLLLFLACGGYLFFGSSFAYAQEERKIYIPYDSEKFETWQTAKDVFLPYETYRELWNATYPEKKTKQESVLPDFVLYNAQYDGKIEKKQVSFSARMNIEVFRAPVTVPIGLEGTSIKEIVVTTKSGEKTSASIEAHETGYRLSMQKAGIYSVYVTFIPRFELAKKRGSFSFQIQSIVSARVKFTLDKDLEVDFKNFQGGWYETLDGEEKTITLFPGEQTNVKMFWYESSERHRAKGLNIAANSTHDFSIQDNTLRMSSSIVYTVTSGKCEKLNLKIPKDYKVINFSCTNLEKWTFIREANHNEIKIQLVDAKQRNLRITMQIEKKYDPKKEEYIFPEVEPIGINRENGNVRLTYEDPYKIKVTDASLVRKVRSNLNQGRFSEVFRYSQHPYTLKFSILQQKYKNFLHSNITCNIEKNKAKIALHATLGIKGKQVFRYSILCPKKWEVKKVEEKKGWKGNIADWRISKYTDDWNSLEIVFFRSRKKGSQASMYVELEQKYSQKSSIPFPIFKGENVTHESGTILFSSTSDLELHSADVRGIQQDNTSLFRSTEHGMIKRFAYRYDGIDYDGKISSTLRTAEISITNVINLLLKDDWVNFGYFIEFDVKYAGVDTFHFRLPKKLGPNLDISGENIRDKNMVTTEKYNSWTVSLHNKITGKYKLSLFPDVIKNNGKEIIFHNILFPKEIKKQTNIVIQNHSQYEIAEQKIQGITATNIKQISFLPPNTEASDFIRAYKANQTDWELTFSENKQKIKYSIHASIDAIKVDTVLQKTGECYHQVIFNLRHSGLQFLELEKNPKLKIWGAFIGNRFVRPSQKKKEQTILIPLFNIGHKEQKIAIRIVYEQKYNAVKNGAKFSFALPKVLNVSEINDVVWTFHAPKNFMYKYDGNVSKVSQSNFQRYSENSNTVHIVSKTTNRYNLQKALLNSNTLKKHNDKWVNEEQSKQNRLFADLQDVNQQRNMTQNFSNIKKIEQYGRTNLQAAQRVRHGNRKVMIDEKDNSLAGKTQTSFLEMQNKVTIDRMDKKQKEIQRQSETSFYFDIHIPNKMKSQTFAKKQGKATLIVRSYERPQDSNFWTGVQFAGLFLLILLASFAKIFSLKNYTFQRFILTIVIILGGIFFCNFTSYIHNFYF